MTELAAPQISSLMEALPGIAQVLRSPVASAMVDLIRSGAGLGDFRVDDAEELLRFGSRRNLIAEEEADQLLLEVRAAVGRSGKRSPDKAAKAKAKARAEKAIRPKGAARKTVQQPPASAATGKKSTASKPVAKKAAAKPVAKKAAAKPVAKKAAAKPVAKKAAAKKAPAKRAVAKKAPAKKKAPVKKKAATKAKTGSKKKATARRR